MPAHRSPLLLTPGQAGDNPQLLPLLEAHKDQDANPFRLLAGKAYSHPSTRTELRSRRIKHTIPERLDQIERRKAKGSARWPATGLRSGAL